MKYTNFFARIVIVISIIFIMSSCEYIEKDDNSSEVSQSSQEMSDYIGQQPLTEVDLLNDELHLCIKGKSNAETVNTIAEYTQKMKTLIDKYNNLMLNFVPQKGPEGSVYENYQEGVPAAFARDRVAWEQYVSEELYAKEQYIYAIYMNGTTKSTAYTWSEYNLYYDRASELYALCVGLNLL